MKFDLTNEKYWAAQDPRVQTIRTLNTPEGVPDKGAREALASQLYKLGFNPDYYIWVNGVDAGIMMVARASLGLTWLPNMFSSTVFTYADIGKPPEPRAVLVSADSDKFPSFVPPPDPINPPSGYVGAENGGMFLAINVRLASGAWAFNEGDLLPGGHNGQVLYFHLVFPMGVPEAVWTASKGPVL